MNITNTNNVTNGASSTSTSSAGNIGNQFMNMLVAQLKNQDPLNPMDPSAMTGQLTQLSSLQQLESMNSLLSAWVGGNNSMSAELSQASIAVGKNADLSLNNGKLAFDTTNPTLHFDFNGGKPYAAKLVATDANGTVLGTWDLKGNSGDISVQNIPSNAQWTVQSVYENGKTDVKNSGSSFLTQTINVTGVTLQNGQVFLMNKEGQKGAWNNVIGIR